MGLAADWKGCELATWNGGDIVLGERIATGKLSEATDFHYGRNWAPEKTVPPEFEPHLLPKYRLYGPRGMDIKNRGGAVAELNWELWTQEPIQLEENGFVAFFNNFNNKAPKNLKTVEKEINWKTKETVQVAVFNRPGSMMKTLIHEDVHGKQKYDYDRQTLKTEHKGQLVFDQQSKKGSTVGYDMKSPVQGAQFGTRWSKTSLMWCRKKLDGRVHFHLEGLGSIDGIVNRKGTDYSYAVTARELRFVFRNWTETFRGHVDFYNGYTKDGQAVQVNCPWDQTVERVELN